MGGGAEEVLESWHSVPGGGVPDTVDANCRTEPESHLELAFMVCSAVRACLSVQASKGLPTEAASTSPQGKGIPRPDLYGWSSARSGDKEHAWNALPDCAAWHSEAACPCYAKYCQEAANRQCQQCSLARSEKLAQNPTSVGEDSQSVTKAGGALRPSLCWLLQLHPHCLVLAFLLSPVMIL